LYDEHAALNATFTDFAGWQMPLKYTSELAEHRAVRTTAGLFDLSHMGEIAVRGPQAAAALDYALAGKMSAVTPGRAKYSLLCDESGGVIDDLVVYRLADEDYMVVANAANAGRVVDELTERAAEFDAEVVDESAGTALLALQGPLAASLLTTLLDEAGRAALPGLKYYAIMRATVAGLDVLLARTGYTGEDGFELYVDAAQSPQLWRPLLDAATGANGLACGLACRDTLRLEAGMALYGHELSTATNPYEAGLGRTVALDTEFVGSAALQRLSEQEPARRLIGLIGSGRRAARAGYPILAGGEPVGVVTSGALSPTLGYPVALGYVDASAAEVGTPLAVDIRGAAVDYTVTAPPFYKRPRS
jgi:aminomethyltransferase